MAHGLVLFIRNKLGITPSRKKIGVLEPIKNSDNAKIKRIEEMRTILRRDKDISNLMEVADQKGYSFGFVSRENREIHFGVCNTADKEIKLPNSSTEEMALIAIHELVHVQQDCNAITLDSDVLNKDAFYDFKLRKEMHAYTEQFRKAQSIFTQDELENLAQNPVYGQHVRFVQDKKLFKNQYTLQADVEKLAEHIEKDLVTSKTFTARLGWNWAYIAQGQKRTEPLDEKTMIKIQECKEKLSMTIDGSAHIPIHAYNFKEDYTQQQFADGNYGAFYIPHQVQVSIIKSNSELQPVKNKIVSVYPRLAV